MTTSNQLKDQAYLRLLKIVAQARLGLETDDKLLKEFIDLTVNAAVMKTIEHLEKAWSKQ